MRSPCTDHRHTSGPVARCAGVLLAGALMLSGCSTLDWSGAAESWLKALCDSSTRIGCNDPANDA